MLPLKIEKLFFYLIVILMCFLLLAYRFFPLDYEVDINNVALEMNINPALIAAIIKLESNFNELALSHSGAFGLMQLMPETAQWLSTKYLIQGSWREPVNNIKLGTYYLTILFSEFQNDFHHTLNAYHMGPNRLKSILQENENFKKSSYTKRIVLYQKTYRILYDGFLISLGE